MDVQLLGDFQILHEGRPLNLGGHQQRCVLAVLLLDPGRTVSVERIVTRAWPAESPDTAKDLVTSYISRLRGLLKPVEQDIELVNHRPAGYSVRVDTERIDAFRFTDLLRKARADRDALDPQRAADHLHQALDQWRGPALAGLTSPSLDAERLRLENLRLDALEDLADLELRADRAGQVVAQLRELARAHPHRQRLTLLAVRALVAVGEQNQASDLVTETIRTLQEQGLDPGPALRQAQVDALRPSIHPPADTLVPARTQLPADTPAFTGRTRELGQLDALVRTGRTAASVVTCTIDGMPGIGKTGFAIHAAHALAEDFPGGQLFINLHGYTPDVEPTRPEIALDQLLRALGAPTSHVPLGPDERAALYRQRLANTRTLIVLDNAASEAQVRPLLPGTPGCLVLVTSRRRLTGLDDAHTITLAALPDDEATTLFATIAGPGRISAGDPALPKTISLCGNVPLTLRITAARLHHRPNWSLRYLAERLDDQTKRLALLADGDRSLAAALNVSYDHLTGEEQGLLRHLGLHPGTDIDLYAAAALIDSTTTTAEMLLEGLVDHNLLTQPSPGRYQFHDLIRLYTRDLAASTYSPEAQRVAVERLLGYFLHMARKANRLLSRHSFNHAPAAVQEPVTTPTLVNDAQAIVWMDVERSNLTAMVDYCDQAGLRSYVVTLSDAMHSTLHIQGHWPLAERLQTAALATAKNQHDAQGQANALCHLADITLLTGHYARAVEYSNNALMLFRTIGDRAGEANACCIQAQASRLTSRFSQSVHALRRALTLYAGLGDRLGEATALTILGGVQKLRGQYPEALVNLDRAYRLCAESGHGYGQAAALADLGEVQQLTGEYFTAVRTMGKALDLYRRLGNRLGEASTLTCLGEIRRLLRQYTKAERLLRLALDLHRQLDNRLGEAESLTFLGVIQNARGDAEASFATLTQACALYQGLENRLGHAYALTALADTQRELGRRETAVGTRRRALSLLEQIEGEL
ncbi:MAG TPA: BTAD domain-containing putative transcriptional regulator [Actinocrinis sp.]|nr:BTAD domain-containing putative transcriptional regulator [Actinocrinis sp.]